MTETKQAGRSNFQRIAAILKGFDDINTPRHTREIASELAVSRSSVFSLLRAMVKAGWLARHDHGLLRLGPRARAMAFAPLEPLVPVATTKLTSDPNTQGRANVDLRTELEWDPDLIRTVDAAQFRRDPPWRLGFSNASTNNAWRKAMLQSLSYAHSIQQAQISDLLILDAEDDPEKQLQQVDSLVGEGIDLLLISVVSVTDTRLSDRLSQLAAQGLPIVAVDRRSDDRSSLVSFITASDHRIGRISALWMAEHLNGEGRVWMLSGLESASPALRRQKAALLVFAEFPGIRVENVSYTGWTEAGGYLAIDQLVSQAGPVPDGVWCDSGLQGVGSVRRFLEEGGRVPAHTGGDLNEMYKLCLQHKVPMAALDYPASMGARALELALEVLNGATVPQRLEVPVQVALPRGYETRSVKADVWSELHVSWVHDDKTILSRGPVLRSARSAPVQDKEGSGE